MRLRPAWLLVALAIAIPALAGPAERAFRKGDLARAKRLYEQRLRKSPEDLKARYNLGNVQYRSKDLQEAERAWQAAMKSKDPQLRAPAAHNLGNARLVSGDIGGAIEAYREALRAEPGSADTKYNLELALRLREAQQQQQQQNQDQNKQQQQQQQQQEQQQQQQQQNQQQKQDPQQKPPDQQPQQQKDQNQQQDKQDSSRMPPPQPGDYSKQEAERVLDGLKQEEKDLQADRLRTQGRNLRVEKDW